MANVGTAAAGKTLIGAGNGASPTFADIGTNSGLADHGVLISKGNGAFVAVGPGSLGQILEAQGASSDPIWANNISVMPGVSNLGMVQSAGTTLTIQGANAALSASNVARIDLQSFATPGTQVRYRVTANQSCTQTDIGASTFGLTNGVANATTFPMFVYAVGNAKAASNPETIISFMISRYPNAAISPVAGSIGKAGSIVANSQGSFFALDSSITVADYAESPCVCVGSLRVTRSAANALSFTTMDGGDGVGLFQLDRIFTLSAGQFGAAAGAFFANNGGTAPVFSANNFGYKLTRDNLIVMNSLFTDCTTAGVGAVALQFATPFKMFGEVIGSGRVITAASSSFTGVSNSVAPTNNQFVVLYLVNDVSQVAPLLNNQVTLSATYQISHSYTGFIQFT